MKQRIVIVWLGILSALILGALSGFVLVGHDTAFRVTMALSVAAALLNLLAIPFFIVGLKHFKIELQHAYTVLCVGIGVFGLAQVQLPLVNLYDWGLWLNTGGIAIPYLIGVICIFLSMRTLSQLLDIRSVGRSLWLAFLATIIISLGVALLPHVKVSSDELSYHISLALSIWNSVFITFATVLALRIRRKIGSIYVHSMKWLFGAFVTLSFAGWHYTLAQLTTTTGNWYYDYSFTIMPFVAGAFVLVIAGYMFDEINASPNAINRKPLTSTQNTYSHTPATVLTPRQELDIVLYVANLVSNPTDIDVALDDVRAITSRLQPGQEPSAQDQLTLDKVYKKLEEYLLHQDALRIFTQEELRGRIAKRFSLNGTIRTTLWQQNKSSTSH